jgi:hypothetical protein
MNRLASSILAPASLFVAGTAQAATSQSDLAALTDGVVFFGGMILLVVIAGWLRIRDARAGLTTAEKQARLKRRLPWVMGAFSGLVIYILLRTM